MTISQTQTLQIMKEKITNEIKFTLEKKPTELKFKLEKMLNSSLN